MLTRRLLLLGSVLALPLLPATMALADHADLEPAADAPVDPMPRRYMMEDLYGNVTTNEDLQGKFVLLYFGYTGCPDVCPTSLSTLADTLDLLGDAAEQVTPVFVTVDPERDTAKLMRDYLAFFDERIIGLRGPKIYTDHMVKAFNARYEKHVPDPAQPDRYAIDHTASIAFLDPQGVLIKRYPHGTSAEDIATDMRAIMDATPQ
ncbi:SCO family protein [Paenirhodobacter sp. CAU 1674]|uniref:SCO family protein n=1 Tax=Paenirhodobacter sp. CAU 1674 TaxID=3032596 RepID=UPI0023DB1125|nr:SCO family protein [Paenirhodobacter sp. CAU 1674]MDF2141831.1 SCO family protein [Paenirhodobacter sp. CAU 1674]